MKAKNTNLGILTLKSKFLNYGTFLNYGIIKTTIVGTFFSIASSVIITLSILKLAGITPREHVIIAIIAPLIIAPIVILLLFKLIIELQDALDRVQILNGLLPICSNCKKIRDDKGYWRQIESYIEKYSDAEFSHGMCPECSDELYGDEGWYLKMKKGQANE